MKNEICELIDKYKRKVAYREERLEKEKATQSIIEEKYFKQECSFEKLYNQQRNVAIQQDLLIELVEILNDLKNIVK